MTRFRAGCVDSINTSLVKKTTWHCSPSLLGYTFILHSVIPTDLGPQEFLALFLSHFCCLAVAHRAFTAMCDAPHQIYSTTQPFPYTFLCVIFLAGNGQPIPVPPAPSVRMYGTAQMSRNLPPSRVATSLIGFP